MHTCLCIVWKRHWATLLYQAAGQEGNALNAIALSMKEKGPCEHYWGSRQGEGGAPMAVDSALSVGRWRGTGCPQQASLWRALKREPTVSCVVTRRQAHALQRNYLWEQEEGVPGTLGLLSVSLPQKPVCTVPMEAPSGWSVGSALHSCARGWQCGPDGRGGGNANTEGSVTTRAWGSPWQLRSCMSETDCWGGLADGHQLFCRERYFFPFI